MQCLALYFRLFMILFSGLCCGDGWDFYVTSKIHVVRDKTASMKFAGFSFANWVMADGFNAVFGHIFLGRVSIYRSNLSRAIHIIWHLLNSLKLKKVENKTRNFHRSSTLKFLLMHKKCNYRKIVPEKSHLKVTGGLKSQQTHNLAILSSTVHLTEVILALWTSK